MVNIPTDFDVIMKPIDFDDHPQPRNEDYLLNYEYIIMWNMCASDDIHCTFSHLPIAIAKVRAKHIHSM